MSGPIEVILIIVVIGYLLIRRLIGEAAEGRRMLLLPAILTAIGLMDLAKVAQSPVSIGFLIATTAVSVVLGLLRGATIRVFEQDGLVFMRYRVITVVLLALNFAIKFGASFALGLVDPSAEHAASNGLLLTLGSGLLVEGLVVLSKAVRTNSRILWKQGKDGEPHKTSSFLDGLQQRAHSGAWSEAARDRGFGSRPDDDRR
ncbi:DUF1453 domain-containing protein [Gryllotalpicola reticulitermitis]|uniref:DUF1453 domain-containing protein n=1 Tax=Gryllotalpicola reticulitermitis TaxID=1184153 RepID=A0ABV8Q844_9MICO